MTVKYTHKSEKRKVSYSVLEKLIYTSNQPEVLQMPNAITKHKETLLHTLRENI